MLPRWLLILLDHEQKWKPGAEGRAALPVAAARGRQRPASRLRVTHLCGVHLRTLSDGSHARARTHAHILV